MTRPTSAVARLARFGFADAARAEELLGSEVLRLWDGGAEYVADPAAAAVLGTLARSADPDLALRQLHRIAEAAGRLGAPDPVAAIKTDHLLRERLIAVLGASAALGDHLAANPAETLALSEVEGGDLDPGGVADDWSGSGRGGGRAEPALSLLRLAYRRGLLRIAAADLTGAQDIERTMTELSELADATLRAACRLATLHIGGSRASAEKPRLAVVAMGKCGGCELNYVSDVDVIFVAANDEDLAPATAIATRLMEICGMVAWPVDAALRPEGSRGPLVRTLASHLAYYRKWARTWEFQALLKARPVAGDVALGEEWLAALQPLIWRAAERPEAVDDVRAMRRRILSNIPREELDREIKRGPGGLRDIEFAVQLLQLVHGRGDESLRSPSTLEGLRRLVDGGYVGRADGEALVDAYRFLRGVEHRLQLQRLRRTHTVPLEERALRWLANALGYTRDPVASFRADWVAHAGQVRRLHAKLLYRPLLEAVARVPAEQLRLSPDAARARLATLGFADPNGALRHIQALTGGVSRAAAIQRTLLPVLLEEFADVPEPDRGVLAYRQVSEKLGTTPWYLRLLRDEGPVALRLGRLLGISRYVVDLLVRDPEALRLLADPSELAPRSPSSLVEGFTAAAARHQEAGGPDSAAPAGPAPEGSPERAIAAVRALRRRELFRIACTDLLSPAGNGLAPVSILDVVAVGQALSDITDATLAAALQIAHGTPGLRFTIIGMGRLGGYEMSYPSDADVLFVYEPPDGMAEDEASGAAHAIAEEMRRLLGMPTPDPALGIDADLRPEGRQGPLVRSLAAYTQYYARWARVWETQALLRARYVCGDPELGERFLALADRVRYPLGGLSREQVTEILRIKARVDNERLPRRADPLTHTKLGRGGLADIEWTVQLLQLRYAHAVPGLRTTRTIDALMAAQGAELVSPADAASLAAAWHLASRVRNALTLVRGRPSDQLPRHGVELAGAVRALGESDPGAFVDEYLRTTRHARTAVDRIFGG
jgi:glutamate-ammonia-ligase adenylyltransferase